MNREYHRWYSPSLGRDMDLLVFGHAGARAIVFPDVDGKVLRVGGSRHDHARSASRSSAGGCSCTAWTASTRTAGTPSGSGRAIARTVTRSTTPTCATRCVPLTCRGNQTPVSDDDGRELRRVSRRDVRAALSAPRGPGDRHERDVRHSASRRMAIRTRRSTITIRPISSWARTTRIGWPRSNGST